MKLISNPFALRRWLIIVLFLLAVVAISGGVWRYGYVQALGQLAQRGRVDLALATDRLTGQLQQYQQLAVLTADHPVVRDVLAGAGPERAEQLLLKAADKTAALDLVVVDPNGFVIVSANNLTARNLSDRAHWRRALQGAMGEEHGVINATGQRTYSFAAPVFSADNADKGKVQGALIVVANIDRIEEEWRGARPSIFFTNTGTDTGAGTGGEVFITNRSELLYWRRQADGQLIPNTGVSTSFGARNVGGYELWLTDWSAYVPARGLHLEQDLPAIAMRAEALIDVDPARRLAGLQAAVVAAVFLTFGALTLIATTRRDALAQANAVLEDRVAARTKELSQANDSLRGEVSERIAAEGALKKAQDDLVQAGKLSALGQMSAGISHELNQPLMAIRQYAENGSAFMERGRPERAEENLSRIADMAARMARIIKNLRAFARNESEPVGQIDLLHVVNTAVELTEARLKADEVTLNWDAGATDSPLWVRAGDVRLTQVLVNLINNAADAMLDQSERRVDIEITAQPRPTITVRDIGPGLKEPDKVFEPFYSTKTVGSSEGMGLGLSISYGLVQSFGGRIRGSNGATGAMFTVELEPWGEGNTG
ncbi:ATP-binding protein [Thalassobius sp. Cn5-15]|uniref:ATP-binding protein n=1 Tax=Thalassobius sp. Cn5-15 TaxID=2917763 RepID=UPI001EF327FB|nr:ATP-binding protein [Thalassobius sp. Cn5-15]MCG7491991.1 ATP-binding protein [Thalassobius sp. Cn5-15]